MSEDFDVRARQQAHRNAHGPDPNHARKLSEQAALWDDWTARCPSCGGVRTGHIEELKRPCPCLSGGGHE